MGEITIFESQSAPFLCRRIVVYQNKNEKNTDEKIHLSFHRTHTDVYVGAKDHHQNTYCNTPKNEY